MRDKTDEADAICQAEFVEGQHQLDVFISFEAYFSRGPIRPGFRNFLERSPPNKLIFVGIRNALGAIVEDVCSDRSRHSRCGGKLST